MVKLRILLGWWFLLPAVAQANQAAKVAADSQARIVRGEAPGWWHPVPPLEIEKAIASRVGKLVEAIEWGEGEREEVTALMEQHYARVWAWHQQVDVRLDRAWAEWDEARSNRGGKGKDELRALAVMTERIDPIYAEFVPQIQGLLITLRDRVGEERTVALLDRITWSPGAKRTYHAYLEMVPQLKEEEKAVLWSRMAQAREASLAAWSSKRIVKIFKKHKVRNEFSIDYFGYGYRKHYEAWVKSKR